jgi:hypothetical protein
LGQQNVVSDKSWEAVILEDFSEFLKAGLTLMQDIEKAWELIGVEAFLLHLLRSGSGTTRTQADPAIRGARPGNLDHCGFCQEAAECEG